MNAFRIIVLIAVLGAIVWQQWKWRSACKAAAAKILRELTTMYRAEHEYRVVSPADFPAVDPTGYARVRESLEASGFRHLGAVENLTVSRVYPAQRTFMECYANATEQLGAYTYRIAQYQVVDIGCFLSDGRYLLTTNAEADKLTPAPSVLKLSMPADTPVEGLLARHASRLAELRAVSPVTTATDLDEAVAIARRYSGVVGEYRRRVGYITEEELLRLAAKGQAATARRVWSYFDALREPKPLDLRKNAGDQS